MAPSPVLSRRQRLLRATAELERKLRQDRQQVHAIARTRMLRLCRASRFERWIAL